PDWSSDVCSSDLIPLDQVDSLLLVDRLPEMQRHSGFSWKAKEKGIFTDSVHGFDVHVFVDDLWQQKIKMVHHDSLILYVNLQDSVRTQIGRASCRESVQIRVSH